MRKIRELLRLKYELGLYSVPHSPGPLRGRRSPHGPDRRDLPQAPPGRRSPADPPERRLCDRTVAHADHRAHAEWAPSRLIAWGRKTGPHRVAFVKQLLESRPHPEQGYRSCLGLMRLLRDYSAEPLEATCHRPPAASGPRLATARPLANIARC